MSNVTTWADGYGRWHAEVDDTPRGLTNAVNAIADEIQNREPSHTYISDTRKYVSRNIISLPSEKAGRIHFAEYEV